MRTNIITIRADIIIWHHFGSLAKVSWGLVGMQRKRKQQVQAAIAARKQLCTSRRGKMLHIILQKMK